MCMNHAIGCQALFLAVYCEHKCTRDIEVAQIAHRGWQLDAHSRARSLTVEPGFESPFGVRRIKPRPLVILGYRRTPPIKFVKIVVTGLLAFFIDHLKPR